MEKNEIIYKVMDSQANLMDARDAIIEMVSSSKRALTYIIKSLEKSKTVNERINNITKRAV